MAQRRHRLLLLMSPSTYRAQAFLTAAASLDLEVVRGVDLPKELSEHWQVPLALDFSQPDEATAAIVRYNAAHPLDAIVAVDDSATLLAARAATALGLPGNDPASAEAARDKGIMRERLAAAGAPGPGVRRFPLARAAQAVAAEVRYPCVLKPLRLSGSRGVIRADTPSEFVAAHERLRRLLLRDGNPLESTEILVEDFIPGAEIAMEGLLLDGHLHVLAIFDKPDPLDGPFFEETIYVTPSRLPEQTQQAIAACGAQAAAAVGLRHGPVHAEMRLPSEGPVLLEIAGRSIGGLCSTILEFGTGMCLEELILRAALRLEVPTLERTGAAAGAMMLPIPRAGVLRAVEGVERACAVPGITGFELTAKLHTPVVPLPEGSSYLGFLFARAATPLEAEQALRAAHAELRFDIRPLLPVLR